MEQTNITVVENAQAENAVAHIEADTARAEAVAEQAPAVVEAAAAAAIANAEASTAEAEARQALAEVTAENAAEIIAAETTPELEIDSEWLAEKFASLENQTAEHRQAVSQLITEMLAPLSTALTAMQSTLTELVVRIPNPSPLTPPASTETPVTETVTPAAPENEGGPEVPKTPAKRRVHRV